MTAEKSVANNIEGEELHGAENKAKICREKGGNNVYGDAQLAEAADR